MHPAICPANLVVWTRRPALLFLYIPFTPCCIQICKSSLVLYSTSSDTGHSYYKTIFGYSSLFALARHRTVVYTLYRRSSYQPTERPTSMEEFELIIQHRGTEGLMWLSNEIYYSGELQDGAGTELDHPSRLLSRALKAFHRLQFNVDEHFLFINIVGTSTSRDRLAEAD